MFEAIEMFHESVMREFAAASLEVSPQWEYVGRLQCVHALKTVIFHMLSASLFIQCSSFLVKALQNG